MNPQNLTWRDDQKVAWPMKKLGHALLGAAEGAMLYYLARDWCSGKRQIVEAGSFLGASASLLAKGLKENGNRQADVFVHCFDLWEAKFGGLGDFIREKIDPNFEEGSDFSHIFLQQVEEVADFIEMRKCDFEFATWTGGEIDLLFIDIAKTPTLNRVTLDRFLPSVAVNGLMAQQDFHLLDNPWIQTSIGHLLDYLEVIEPRADDTALFRIRRAIPLEVLREAGRYEDLSYAERLARLETLIDAIRSESFTERYLELVKARLVIESGDRERGLAILKEAQDRVGPNPGREDYFWQWRCDKVLNADYVVN